MTDDTLKIETTLGNACDIIDKLTARLAKVEAERDQAISGLARYGRCEADCTRQNFKWPCSCGFCRFSDEGGLFSKPRSPIFTPREPVAACPQWQPIETAPKNQRILIGGGDCPYVHENELRCFRMAGCAFAGLGNAQQPTHWMPLPSPPLPGSS